MGNRGSKPERDVKPASAVEVTEATTSTEVEQASIEESTVTQLVTEARAGARKSIDASAKPAAANGTASGNVAHAQVAAPTPPASGQQSAGPVQPPVPALATREESSSTTALANSSSTAGAASAPAMETKPEPATTEASPGPLLTGGAAVLARLRAKQAANPTPTVTTEAGISATPTATTPAADSAAMPSTSLSGSAESQPAAAAAAAAAAQPPAATAQAQSSSASPAAADGPVAMTGGAAILARLKSKASAASSSAASSTAAVVNNKVMFLYGSQTSTCQEIARNLHSEAVQKGMNAEVMSISELGWANLTAEKTPYVVLVTSSTGDGDPPDNAAAAWVQMKKQQPADRLKGVQFTTLGLGDSNYTRFMHVPRTFRQRFEELGAQVFYKHAEADEVEGVENIVDPWIEGLWAPLQAALAAPAKATAPAAAAEEAKAAAPAAAAEEAKAAAPAAAAVTVTAAGSKVMFLYGSQTSTCQEIARNLHSEAVQKGMNAEVMSISELGWANVTAEKTPYVVLVTSSTGDGDPPDNAAAAWVQMKKQQPADRLKGIQFTTLGLGDSNYTRFMHVPRTFRQRFEELGAQVFYKHAEADEVEGVENIVDPWIEGLWAPLQAALAAPAKAAAPAAAAAEPKSAAAEEEEPKAGAAAAPAAAATTSVDQPQAAVSAAAAPASESAAAAAAAASEQAASSQPEAPAAPSAEAAAAAPAADVAPVESTSETPASAPSAASASAGQTTTATTGDTTTTTTTDTTDTPLVHDLQSIPEDTAPPSTASSSSAPPAPSRKSIDNTSSTTGSARSARKSSEQPRAGTPRRSMDSPRKTSDSPRKSMDAGASGTPRKSMDKPPSRLSTKPISVQFPKREETVVPRKDESAYGLNLGLAPVGVDLKGAPAPMVSRVRVSVEKDAAKIAQVKAQEAARPSAEQLAYRDEAGTYSADQPFWARLSDARYETAFWSDRKVLHLQFELADSNMSVEAGDAIGVVAQNSRDLVVTLIKKLGLQPDVVISARATDGSDKRVLPHIPLPCTLGYALERCVDLTSATKKSVLRIMAEHCSDAAQKRTLTYLTSKAGRDAYQHEIMEHQPSIVDLLTRFDSCTLPLDVLLDALPPLNPRLYSITNSPAALPGKAQVALSVVRFRTRYGQRPGVASTWLDRLAQPYANGDMMPNEPIRVPIFLRRNVDFRHPANLASPIIMVGPGTGVAPFRGFLQQRRADLRSAGHAEGSLAKGQAPPEGVGESWLFFGCRREDEDYLYRDDLAALEADGTLTHLKVAFSRAQQDKVYVQDLVRQEGATLAKLLLEKETYFFVCGDGASMAKDVHAALLEILVQHGGLSQEEATQKMASLTQLRRYIRDIWS